MCVFIINLIFSFLLFCLGVLVISDCGLNFRGRVVLEVCFAFLSQSRRGGARTYTVILDTVAPHPIHLHSARITSDFEKFYGCWLMRSLEDRLAFCRLCEGFLTLPPGRRRLSLSALAWGCCSPLLCRCVSYIVLLLGFLMRYRRPMLAQGVIAIVQRTSVWRIASQSLAGKLEHRILAFARVRHCSLRHLGKFRAIS